ncbi:MAG: AzlD domain-containing protein [Anaerolineales bacterium]
MATWLIILGMGIVTYAIRLSLIGAVKQLTLPPLVMRGLRFVPPAVLSAIILPEVLQPAGHIDITLANPRLLAGIIAALVAWRTRNVVATVVVGLVVVWLIQALVH